MQLDAGLLKGAWRPTSVTAAILLIVGWAVADVPGLLGAGAGAAVVTAFFVAGSLAIGYGARISPTAMLTMALGSYVVKIALLGVLLVAMRNVTVLDGTVFGWSVLVCTLVWVATQVRMFSRQRILYVDPAEDRR